MQVNRNTHLPFIYKCTVCTQYFPIWYVPDAEWQYTCEVGRWKRKDRICKSCFEEAVPEPHYLTVDEYMEQRINTFDKDGMIMVKEAMRPILEELWDLPSSYTPEERAYILGRGSK
jgi:hypothetical protein